MKCPTSHPFPKITQWIQIFQTAILKEMPVKINDLSPLSSLKEQHREGALKPYLKPLYCLSPILIEDLGLEVALRAISSAHNGKKLSKLTSLGLRRAVLSIIMGWAVCLKKSGLSWYLKGQLFLHGLGRFLNTQTKESRTIAAKIWKKNTRDKIQVRE